MKLFFLVLVFLAGSVNALHPIIIKGTRFFDKVTQEQFFVKGVSYQPRTNHVLIDPLADPVACRRDSALMAHLGLNVIRVYEVDPANNHDECMKSFADAGIYILLDIATPKFSVNRARPEYDVRLLQAYRATIDAFGDYNNIFAFLAGNEVTNDKTNTLASAYVKAGVRDIKRYLRDTRRYIPVGYANNDDGDIRDAIRDYFSCGDPDDQVDFFGVNLYEWCGKSTFEKSGYADRTREFDKFNKPVFLTEYGCNLVSPREFGEVEAIYSPAMTGVWSGGVVYEWTQENNNYGLVQQNPTNLTLLPDYTNLKDALSRVSPHKTHLQDAPESGQEQVDCPGLSEVWKASSILPPTPLNETCTCAKQNVVCTASDKIPDIEDRTTGIDSNSSLVVGAQIDMLCGLVSCEAIGGDASAGLYGVYSGCSPKQKLSLLYNEYATMTGTCDFDGFALEATPHRTSEDCSNKDKNRVFRPKPSLVTPTEAVAGRLRPSIILVVGLVLVFMLC
ncbi:carbohydrate-binding module family 43 protein [Phycomyces blakesleeanus]|uniref:1,3-beta-glucanosyltransferase n=2 Tax=Phycomyces blakesleeanus TaxID=4837 RepID=A0A167JJB2_PHYB8|nr:carbohydrate-binding module family 43 protein [Phycomyces blakesleeanus NRRL 1555(-)]OAD66099.1 carbohydrate-binding module family 43 protein [Phycomyces blakesleeanus NRRL 1555(-)]|eukprot:XP_018284139.1 carbohydrate-binding module family 43 protein [Phycomyces blakesleeanus NRRL 1555(-)]